MRVVQPAGLRGSLRHIQICVNESPAMIQPVCLPQISWVSPLRHDDYAEYRDAAFLEKLGLGRLAPALKTFWPTRGPQWDALGLTSEGPVLVEAKAHLAEFQSPGTQAGPKSAAQIASAFAQVQRDLGIMPKTDWSQSYYQYANRIAFLWWLHSQGVTAKLLFVSFLNDRDMGGPDDAGTWQTAFSVADQTLGLPARHALSPHILHMSPDVAQREGERA